MRHNDETIEINPKVPRNHEGFVDALDQKLEVGDEIIVWSYRASYHAVLTRFTPKRVYWKVLRGPDSMHPFMFQYENFTQLHQWYSGERDYTDRNGKMTKVAAENTRKLRGIIKYER